MPYTAGKQEEAIGGIQDEDRAIPSPRVFKDFIAKGEDWLGVNLRVGNNEATVSRSTSVRTNKCRT